MADNPAPVALAGVQQAARARHDAVYAQLLAGEVGSTWTITVGGERGAAVTAEKTGQDALQVIFGGFSVKAAWSVEEQLIKASQAPLRLPSVASAFNLGFQSDNPASYFQLLLLEEVGLVILTTAIRQKYNIPHTLEISDPRTLAFKAIEHSLRNIITNVPVAQREATLLDPSVQGPLLFNLAALGRLGLKAAGAPTQKFDEYVARSVAPSGEMDSIIMAAMARGRVRPAGNPTNRDGYRVAVVVTDTVTAEAVITTDTAVVTMVSIIRKEAAVVAVAAVAAAAMESSVASASGAASPVTWQSNVTNEDLGARLHIYL